MKKTVAFLLVLSMLVVALAACGATEEPTTAPAEPTAAPAEPTAAPEEPTAAAEEPSIASEVVVAIGEDPADLSPFTGMSMGRIAVLKTIYEYLVETDKMGTDAVPMIAKSWEQTGDMTYLVTIFDYVYDSAGNHIMASDVAWSYNTAMAEGMMRPLGDIESVTAKLVAQAAAKQQVPMIDIRLSQMEPSDLRGIPFRVDARVE